MEQAVCPVCEGLSARDPFYHDWHDRVFWLMRCRRCTHQFIHPSVTSEEQGMIFTDKYFSALGGWVGNIWDMDYVSAETELRAEAQEILDILPIRAGRLLDIGCAGGVFLDESRRRGFSVEGIEFNESMVRSAMDRYGLEPIQSRIEDVEDEKWGPGFDVITFLDVLEHLPAPGAVLLKAARWLKPDGHLLVRGPMKNSRIVLAKEMLRRVLRIKKHLPGYPLDANQFNTRSMETLLTRTGFRIVDYVNRTSDFSNILARLRDSE